MAAINPARISLAPGSRLGAYEIVAAIGAEGMGDRQHHSSLGLARLSTRLWTNTGDGNHDRGKRQ
jgi:hypothetical protein